MTIVMRGGDLMNPLIWKQPHNKFRQKQLMILKLKTIDRKKPGQLSASSSVFGPTIS